MRRARIARWFMGIGAARAALSGCIPDVIPTPAGTGASSAGPDGGDACVVSNESTRWKVGALGNFEYSAASTSVIDKTTGLTWQREPSADGKLYTYEEAKAACKNLGLDGKVWRVPTRAELISIVDYSVHSPCIDGTAFPNTPYSTPQSEDKAHWTSTTYKKADGSCPTCMYTVGFKDGDVFTTPQDEPCFVRCVR